MRWDGTLIGKGYSVGSTLSLASVPMADTHRIVAARRMIDDRASEKLTLDFIARACGLNRSKLTRGFKEMLDVTVAQAITERRLDRARRMLLTTDRRFRSSVMRAVI